MIEPVYWARLRFEGYTDAWRAFASCRDRWKWIEGVREAMQRANPPCAWSVAKMKRGPKT